MFATPPVVSLTENPNDVQVPFDYVPTDMDICSGRGKAFWNHAGNVAFRNLIQAQVLDYIKAPSKADKTAMVVSIVDDLRQKGCKFLKQETDANGATFWYDIGDALAREKVGHSLRDQVTAINRSNREGSRSPIPGTLPPVPRTLSPVPRTLSPTPPPALFSPATVVSSNASRTPSDYSSFSEPTIPEYPHLIPSQSHNNSNFVTMNAPVVTSNGMSFPNDAASNHWNERDTYQYQYQKPYQQKNQQHYQTQNQQQYQPQSQQPYQPQVHQQYRPPNQPQQYHYEYYYGNNPNEHEVPYDSNAYERRPSLALSDSGNDVEMRRSSLDTSGLLLAFGRRPSMVIDAHEQSGAASSTISNNMYHDDLTRQSIMVTDLMNHNVDGRISHRPVRSRESLRALSSQETRELLTSSIQSINVNSSVKTIPSSVSSSITRSGASRRISGTSTFRMGSSLMREMRLSELSMLSSGLSNISLADLANSISDDDFHYTM